MASQLILLIEDDTDIATILQQDLQDAGYQVQRAGNVMHGLMMAREVRPNLVLLDLGLPDGDGRDVLTRLRRDSDLPVIVLTARDLVGEKVELLSLGADDYIVKPFDVAELLARIAVQFRPEDRGTMMVGELEINSAKRLVLYRNQELHFSAKEFALLNLLMQHPGRVYSREDIIREIWDGELDARSNVLDVHFANIRGKFREVELYGLLRTVRGIGYALRI
jgi:two-component system copper resistance phosphate regulon response regulator CusR